MTTTLAAVLCYLAVQLGIGVWVSRRIHSESDYLVAGRQLGPMLATFSIFATWFGAETIVGSAGTTWREGLSAASSEPFGYGLCLILMGLIFAVPLWRRQLTTLADLFRTRYSVPVERLAAVILVPSSILWAAAQIRAFGQVLSTVAPTIALDAAIGVAAGFVILYTMFGGLLADAMTDLVQGVLLMVSLVVVGVAVFLGVGGWDGLPAAFEATRAARVLREAGTVAPPFLDVLEAWAIPVCGSVIATELVGRIVATRTAQIARRAALTAGALYLVIGLIPVGISLVAGPLVPALADSEQLVPTVARQLLPTLGFALFAGGLISAILSTVDSTLLVASGILSHNVIVPMARISDESVKVRIARGGVLAFGVLAFVLALRAEGVFALVEQASAFGSAGTLVTVCFALFTSLGGARTAAATLVVGVVVYLAGTVGGSSTPFLWSLGLSLATYIIGAMFERSAAPTVAVV
ncbi:MAG: sodium:solute symporter family protein [Gemmatimonadaceae bacterium]|nr:sodium:solute symporter family protein [Gemmatimonadaceae bacterium]